jgi:diacylglycerol kinase (CTP)
MTAMATAENPSRPRRSPSKTKRSPSPIVISSLSSENPKGVKNITRKVIKRLEGLGHLEMVDTDFSLPEEDELDPRFEEHQVKTVLSTPGLDAVKRASPKHRTNGNGAAHVGKTNGPKTDFEIPRKLLHSSIGKPTPFFRVMSWLIG